MFKIIAYLKFLLSSTNQHGVHSPFVYEYVTKCLYQKRLSKASKVKDVLLKSMCYFKTNNVFFDGIDTEFLGEALKIFPNAILNTPPYDLIYIDNSTKGSISTYIGKNIDIHNNTAVLINGIHRNGYEEGLWEDLKHTEPIRVTIDLFYCGLVFYRKEQAKEHFKIRI